MSEPRATKPPAYPHGALPIGTRLGEFEVRRVLGVGGFGIVYLAFDHLLERDVALKEYMPSTLVDRAETMHVSLISQANADTFALGLRSFVNEARLLARFDHPSLVKVHRFWEGNGTAYMAMALYKGRTARDVRLEMQTRPDEAWVRKILEPLLGAIERLHSEDVYHRDIAPDNILIEGDGRPVLLDFGAARRVITDRSQALTAILKPSYAPIEQYADVGGMKQGPWTDIYALGATMHFLLLGRPPLPAPGRSIQDTLKPLAEQDLAGCSREFLELIDWMLTPLPNDRPQNVAAVREALAGRLKPPPRPGPSAFERTAPLAGYGAGSEDATVLMPRGQTAFPPSDDSATVVMPRPGGGNAGPARSSLPQAPPRPPVDDEDATIVTAYPAGYNTRREPPPAAPPPAVPVSPPPPSPPAARDPAPTTTQYLARPQTARSPAPPVAAPVARPSPAARASSKSWMVPVLAGIVVAGAVGGGLWWFLTRPIVPTLNSAPPAASVPESAAPAPAPQPAAPASTAPTELSAPPAALPSPPAATVPLSPPELSPPVASPPRASVSPPPRAAVVRPPARTPEVVPAAPVRKPDLTPAPVVVTPAPAATPAVVDAGNKPKPAEENRPQSPGERCAKELPLVRLICIDLACNRAEFNGHPECVKLRAEQARKRYLEGN
ncbi:MAG: protein kinase [Rubrivivax sp.]|nr:protein kinase [Rubrivivax sp.]MBK7262098.1 protein kinase [Rubrivivax sp.]MBK8528310.1 protein kinase [Rubrivivax sp.]